MSDENGQHIFEKVARLLKQQQEMYGDFEVLKKVESDRVSKLQSDRETELQSDKVIKNAKASLIESEEQSEVSEPKQVYQTEKELTIEEQLEACSNLDELKALCERAEVLKTDLDNTNLVFGVGNPNADLMIIGEAPGENEDKQGEPFVGAAGQLLDKIMKAINFNRSDLYIANILKHRPPNNRDPKPEEREKSLPFLLKQIELVNPKLILCVGKVSATTLLNQDATLKEMRQKFHPFHGRELMVTYHPAALLKNQQWKRPTWEDVQLLRNRYDELGGTP
jgi:DNA polymerase